MTSHRPLASACCFPPSRAADPDTLIVANGFSCQEQIAHGAGRRAIHLAELIQIAFQSQK